MLQSGEKACDIPADFSRILLESESQGQQTPFFVSFRIWDWQHHVAEGNARTPLAVMCIQTGTSPESAQAADTILPKAELRKQQNPW